MKKIVVSLLSLLLIFSMTACSSSPTDSNLTEDEAKKEIKSLMSRVDVSEQEDPVMDIYSDETSEADALASIDTFPLMVEGNGDINIEIAAATEMSSDSPDDWLNVVAKKFNDENKTVNGKSVSVSVRKITSGEVVTYVKANAYKPKVFIPSNEAWGMMLDSYGIKINKIEDRIAGNTAGVLIEKEAYKSFIDKYKKPTLNNILKAANAGDLFFAYTNPYTSSTGLNLLCSMLKSFDNENPLSEKAVNELIEYQKTAPPVAYTTAVLRNSAAKGLINSMVMEEQAYSNTAELKDYEYIPMGIRHDHPVYTFNWTSDEETEATKLFIEYCKSDSMQELATKKGFNKHDDYKGLDLNMSGEDFINAQKVWKQNKNGGKPVMAVFVADVSGSMDGEPLNSMKESLINGMNYIGEDNYIGLVSYSSDVTINLPIEKFDSKQKAYFSGETKNLSANGGTATYDAVLVGLDMLVKKAEEVPDAKMMIFVLTDGEQNEGYDLNRVTPIVGGLKVPVYTIAYNYSDNGELEKLSEINEAACIKADSDDIANHIRNLFNVEI